MSFLLDVADPSIHFHARQCCNSTGAKATIAAASSISSAASKSTTGASVLPGSHSTGASIPTSSMFSTMSRMIRTASSSSFSAFPSLSSSSTTSAAGTPACSGPSTPEAADVSDPFMTSNISNKDGSSTSHHLSPTLTAMTPRSQPGMGIIATSLSPWMMPSVCDDDQMNKLVSFQL